MSAYTAPIIKNGLVMPLLFLVVMLSAGAYALTSVKAESAARDKIYKDYVDRVNNSKLLEEKLKPGRDRQKKVEEMLKAEIKPVISKQLTASMDRYKDKEYELQQVSVKQTEDRGSIGSMVQSNLSRIQMVFRGGFGPMQETLLDLETQFPQLQMEKMVISKTKGFGEDQREALTFNVDYIAWKW
ncbi:hypothetical protein BH11VER1_BH11VER1_34490 [soil metagenome]